MGGERQRGLPIPHVEMTTVTDPTGPGPNELILQVGACGICGSDVHMFETTTRVHAPAVPHALPRGRAVTSSPARSWPSERGDRFEEGDLVTAEEIQWCGVCNPCRGGYWNQCKYMEDLGFTIDGGFAEYVEVDVKHCW